MRKIFLFFLSAFMIIGCSQHLGDGSSVSTTISPTLQYNNTASQH